MTPNNVLKFHLYPSFSYFCYLLFVIGTDLDAYVIHRKRVFATNVTTKYNGIQSPFSIADISDLLMKYGYI